MQSIRVEYDPVLIEKTVRVAVRGRADLEADLHRRIDPVYTESDRERKEQLFGAAFAEAFSRLGLDRCLRGLLRERPILVAGVRRCVVHEAARARSQSAELFVQPGATQPEPEHRTLVLQVCPEALAAPHSLVPWMRRELLHVADMLDAPFGYRRADLDSLPVVCNVVRDRYRVLWDVFVEGRLIREGRAGRDAVEMLWGAFRRTFRPEATARGRFDVLLSDPAITHARLLAWANQPGLLFESEEGPRPAEIADRPPRKPTQERAGAAAAAPSGQRRECMRSASAEGSSAIPNRESASGLPCGEESGTPELLRGEQP